MVVIDASAMLEIVKRTDKGLGLSLELEDENLHAPHLIDLEVTNGLRRLVAKGEIRQADADAAFHFFLQWPIKRYPHRELLEEVWKLRHNLTAYDACYLVLSRVLGARLVTLDSGLRHAAALRVH